MSKIKHKAAKVAPPPAAAASPVETAKAPNKPEYFEYHDQAAIHTDAVTQYHDGRRIDDLWKFFHEATPISKARYDALARTT